MDRSLNPSRKLPRFESWICHWQHSKPLNCGNAVGGFFFILASPALDRGRIPIRRNRLDRRRIVLAVNRLRLPLAAKTRLRMRSMRIACVRGQYRRRWL